MKRGRLLKRKAANDHGKQRDAERPNVDGCRKVRLARHEFRRSIVRRAQPHTLNLIQIDGAIAFVDKHSAQSKINEHSATLLSIDKYILKLCKIS
jgi:hypothetical protein